jgi:tetratricopeptide (TPR) repeat protein
MRARALVSLAVPLFEREGLAAALAILDEAESLADAGSPEGASLHSLSAIQRAGFLARSGAWAEAVDALSGVRADGDLVGDRELAVALLNRGLARQYLGEYRRSEEDLGRAAQVARRSGHTVVQSMAVHNLGCLALLRGEVPTALRLMQEAEEIDAGKSTSTTRLDLARAHIEAGLVRDAQDLLGGALTTATASGLSRTSGEILLELARCAILEGDPVLAADRAEQAAGVFAEHDTPNWRLRADVAVAQAGLAIDPAADHALRRIDHLDASSSRSPALLRDVALLHAEAALSRGDLQRCASALATAGSQGGAVLTSGLHCDLVEARLAAASGETRRRSRVLARASLRLARTSATYSGLDIRTALALHATRLAELDIGSALASGSPGAVFAATERWRALSLRMPTTPAAGQDAALAEAATALRHIRARIAESPDEEERLGARARQLEREISHRERQVAGRAATDEETLTPASYPQVRSALAARRAAAVLYFVHRGRLHALTLGDRPGRLHDLAPADAALELAQRIRADLRALTIAPTPALAAAVRRSLDANLARLGTLVSPAWPADADRVVVVPSRVLPSVPWRMVPGLDGRPLVVAGSASSWTRRSGTSPVRSVVAIAGPGMEEGAEEARLVTRAWGRGSTFAGSDATSAALVDGMASTDLVHVAAHGTHHDEAPLFSSVRLDDGPLFAYELQRRGVGAAHVVLASCDVGRAHVGPGDEALGLTASVLACGARSVLAAVAPVRGEATHEAMTRYHRLLAAGGDAADCLEEATRDLPDGRLFALYGADWGAAA